VIFAVNLPIYLAGTQSIQTATFPKFEIVIQSLIKLLVRATRLRLSMVNNMAMVSKIPHATNSRINLVGRINTAVLQKTIKIADLAAETESLHPPRHPVPHPSTSPYKETTPKIKISLAPIKTTALSLTETTAEEAPETRKLVAVVGETESRSINPLLDARTAAPRTAEIQSSGRRARGVTVVSPRVGTPLTDLLCPPLLPRVGRRAVGTETGRGPETAEKAEKAEGGTALERDPPTLLLDCLFHLAGATNGARIALSPLRLRGGTTHLPEGRPAAVVEVAGRPNLFSLLPQQIGTKTETEKERKTETNEPVAPVLRTSPKSR
jgi:hypothetical protein